MAFSTVRLLVALAVAAALTGLQASGAAAQSRRALVIGADDYRNVSKLQKAVGDARAMKAALEKTGFAVDLLINPDRSAFNTGISEFTAKLGPGDVALIHYSGHGVALDGENYLLPVDAPRPDRVDKEGLKLESFALMPLIERIRATGSNVQIAIVDACRDNPYAKSGTRSIGRGGGLVEPSRRPAKGQGGFFILFSAGFGQTAADRLDDNDREPTSVYTRTLLRKIAVEGKPITDLAREVREDVEELAATVNHEQRPAYYDELSGPLFYFAPPRAGGAVASAPAQPQIVPPAQPQVQPQVAVQPQARTGCTERCRRSSGGRHTELRLPDRYQAGGAGDLCRCRVVGARPQAVRKLLPAGRHVAAGRALRAARPAARLDQAAQCLRQSRAVYRAGL